MSNAQVNIPSASPLVQVSQNIGLVNVKLEYSRPGVKEREIFGSLIPFGKVWRTGANSATKISFNDVIWINGKEVPAGDYAIYTIPQEKEWTVILSKNTKLWGAAGYDIKDDQLRFTLIPEKTKSNNETFTIDFENFTSESGDLIIKWADLKLRLNVKVDTESKVYASIKKQLIDSKEKQEVATYFNAAMYYYDRNKDLDQALVWMNTAVEMRPEAFWYKYFQAELLAHMNKNAEAKEAVSIALKMANSNLPNDYDYAAKCEILLNTLKS